MSNRDISLAIILGSGIELDKSTLNDIKVTYEDNSGIHKKLIYTCMLEGHNTIVFQGRKHYYEGHPVEVLTENIKMIESMGVKNLVITNAAGGINDNYKVGDLMLIKSHINLNNNILCKSKPFPYSTKLKELFEISCRAAKIRLQNGVYGYYQGPTYETKAEIRFQKKFNVDAAGMSTVPEANSASIKGINAIGVSVITNLLKENNLLPPNHESVLSTAKAASANLNKALTALITQLN